MNLLGLLPLTALDGMLVHSAILVRSLQREAIKTFTTDSSGCDCSPLSTTFLGYYLRRSFSCQPKTPGVRTPKKARRKINSFKWTSR